jgi:hypothetical protein
MKYHAPSKGFTVTSDELEHAVGSLTYALRHIRKLAGLPLDRYKKGCCLDDAEHAQRGILDAARKLGIDMGAEWGSDLDLRDADDIPANVPSDLSPSEGTTSGFKARVAEDGD